MLHLLQIIERSNVFSRMYDFFRIFRFFIFTTNNTIDFFQLNLFRIYWRYASIILSFFSYSLGENKLVYSNILLPFNIKSIHPIQKFPYIIESYTCILKICVVIFLLTTNHFDSFSKIFNSKCVKICHIIIIHIQYTIHRHACGVDAALSESLVPIFLVLIVLYRPLSHFKIIAFLKVFYNFTKFLHTFI